MREYSRNKTALNPASIKGLRLLVEGVQRNAAAAEPLDQSIPSELTLAYLDLAGMNIGDRMRSGEFPDPMLLHVRKIGLEALHGQLDAEDGAPLMEWVVTKLMPADRATLKHRVVAASLLAGRQLEISRDSLLLIAKSEKKVLLRAEALKALVGWPDIEITRFILNGIDLGGRAKKNQLPIPLSVAVDHLEQLATLPPDEDLQVEILGFLAPHLEADSWREASRGLELFRSLTSDKIYPVLFDALETWVDRRGTESASKRVENDIVDELSRRSGRFLRDRHERWRNWWKLVQAGTVPPPAPAGEDDGGSKASFFSLRAVTQRVTFIIDRSGSMNANFGGESGHSRFDEAINQTISFLQLSGADTEFNVILFSDEHIRWKARLQPANERNLEQLRAWLHGNGPGGATHLREAVEDALELRRDGSADLTRLVSDTMIVLCDGVTDSGPDWVVPTLAAINESAQLVFNCVRIGNQGDGSLELLARETSGSFIQIKK